MTRDRYPNSPGFTAGEPTSEAAADSMEEAAPKLRDKILGLLEPRKQYGATCFDLEAITGLSHQTVSPRLSELRHKGYIVDSLQRRPSPSNRDVIVWVVRKYATTEAIDHPSNIITLINESGHFHDEDDEE
jgi:hypothetical protein